MEWKRKKIRKTHKGFIIGVLGILLLAVIGFIYWYTGNSKDSRVDKNMEKPEMQVVQFYLHLPEGDVIVGRENKGFSNLVAVTQKVLTSVADSDKNPLDGAEDADKALGEIQRNSVSLSVWLMTPYKVQPLTKSAAGKEKNKAKVYETDRILLIFGGEHMGTILTREAASGNWAALKASGESVRELAEIIRSGQL